MATDINFLLILKRTAELFNQYATLILVIITAIYAYFTYKMARLMRKQVVADIRVSNLILGSSFEESWFKVYVKDPPKNIYGGTHCEFKLLFDVRNRSSGSGCIDKPTLVFKFRNDGFQYSVPPITKSIRWIPYPNNPSASESETTDYGGTIYLRGGESQKIELEYETQLNEELLKHIKETPNSFEYWIKFTDNLGKNYSLKIIDVRSK